MRHCSTRWGTNENGNLFQHDDFQMKHIQVELKQLSADVTEIKKTSSRALRKTESLEKEMQRMKAILDDLQGSRVGTSESGGAKPMASGDVELRPQVRCALN